MKHEARELLPVSAANSHFVQILLLSMDNISCSTPTVRCVCARSNSVDIVCFANKKEARAFKVSAL